MQPPTNRSGGGSAVGLVELTVGEDYLPLGNTEVAPIISKIKVALPDGGIIINTLNGDQNVAFFKQIQDAGITPSNGYYVMTVSYTHLTLPTKA